MRLLDLEAAFPKLASAGYKKTSEKTPWDKPGKYNCIAWAANDKRCWWWPHLDVYWPPWCKSREETVECFVRTFAWLGYRPCNSSRLEFGFEKVALYAVHISGVPRNPPTDWRDLKEWIPKHMARQLRNGAWSSKCGPEEDITHYTLDALERYGLFGNTRSAYGCACVYMRRLVVVGYVIRLLQRIYWKFEPAPY